MESHFAKFNAHQSYPLYSIIKCSMELLSHTHTLAFLFPSLSPLPPAALENGHIKYTSRHNKLDMTTVITILMVQVISAITTTHQCVTRDIIEKNERYQCTWTQICVYICVHPHQWCCT